MTRLLPKYKSVLFFKFFLYFIFLSTSLEAQTPIKKFEVEDYSHKLYSTYEHKKTIPDNIKNQALTALSFYPELKDRRITFRFRKRKTPLSSRPRLFSLFKKKKNRRYVITISTKTISRLEPILFLNLPYNAQIGVLGHEIGHVVEYNQKTNLQIISLGFKLLNASYVNNFEFNTDRISIEHGLGHQLYDWSSYVRHILNIEKWGGASNISSTNQRYMNPETILSEMERYSIYQQAD